MASVEAGPQCPIALVTSSHLFSMGAVTYNSEKKERKILIKGQSQIKSSCFDDFSNLEFMTNVSVLIESFPVRLVNLRQLIPSLSLFFFHRVSLLFHVSAI